MHTNKEREKEEGRDNLTNTRAHVQETQQRDAQSKLGNKKNVTLKATKRDPLKQNGEHSARKQRQKKRQKINRIHTLVSEHAQKRKQPRK
jgi:hypothetical protein